MNSLMSKQLYKSYIAIFIIALFLFLFISVIAFKQLLEMNKSQKVVSETHELQQRIDHLLIHLLNAETGQRGYLIAGDKLFLTPYKLGVADLQNEIIVIKQKLQNDNELKKAFSKVEYLCNKRLSLLSYRIQMYERDPTVVNQDSFQAGFRQGKFFMDSLRIQIKEINKIIKNRLDLNQHQLNKYKINTPIGVISACLFSLILILLAFIKISQDHKKLQDTFYELKNSNEILNHAQKVANMGCWIWNMSNQKLFFSDQHFLQLGYEPNEYEPNTHKFLSFVHPDDLEAVNAFSQGILEGERNDTFLYRVFKKDGSMIYIKTIYDFSVNAKGQKIVTGVNLDMTEDVLQQTKLQQQNDELLKANSELSSFNNIASHDLQEPLRKIQLFISRIESDKQNQLSEKSNEFFVKIKSSAVRMQELLKDLLAYARITKTDKVTEQINMNNLFEKIMQEWSQAIEDKKAQVNIQPTMCDIKGVPFLLQTLFSNLVGNSLKYASANRPPVINVSCEITKQSVINNFEGNTKYCKITIADNGIGFDNQYANKIFEMFQRLHDKSLYMGSGIGLALCKKIVETHKGFITAEGKPNEGAVFTVFLPLI